MGDDEFFGTSGPGDTIARNPLTLDELACFGRQLLNIAFALYWREDQTLLREGKKYQSVYWAFILESTFLLSCLRFVNEN
jgi:hypothetical protein